MANEMKNSDVIECFDFELSVNKNVNRAFDFITSKVNVDESISAALKARLRMFHMRVKKMWKSSSDKKSFEARHEKWLNGSYEIEKLIKKLQQAKESISSGDRPSKKRRLESETLDPKTDSVSKALLLAKKTAYNNKKYALAELLKYINKRQDDALHMRQYLKSHRAITRQEALSYFEKWDMSKEKYLEFRSSFDDRGIKCPSYKDIMKLKAGVEEAASSSDSDDESNEIPGTLDDEPSEIPGTLDNAIESKVEVENGNQDNNELVVAS